jgi:serine/threonine protein kinase
LQKYDHEKKNILQSSRDSVKKTERRDFQISDFGLCRTLINDEYTSKGGPLPIKWMAPESLQHMEFSTKSDVLVFFLA